MVFNNFFGREVWDLERAKESYLKVSFKELFFKVKEKVQIQSLEVWVNTKVLKFQTENFKKHHIMDMITQYDLLGCANSFALSSRSLQMFWDSYPAMLNFLCFSSQDQKSVIPKDHSLFIILLPL